MSEYEKYQELQTKSQRMQEDYEKQLQEMEDAKEHALEELTEYYEKKLQGKFSLSCFHRRLFENISVSIINIISRNVQNNNRSRKPVCHNRSGKGLVFCDD